MNLEGASNWLKGLNHLTDVVDTLNAHSSESMMNKIHERLLEAMTDERMEYLCDMFSVDDMDRVQGLIALCVKLEGEAQALLDRPETEQPDSSILGDTVWGLQAGLESSAPCQRCK